MELPKNYAHFHRANGNIIHPTAWIGEMVTMGTGNYVEAGAIIGAAGHIREVEPKDMKGTIVIGDNNRFGANSVIHYGVDGCTSIADNNLIMGFVNIGHNVNILHDIEICPHTTIAGWVNIRSDVKIKMNCTINGRLMIDFKSFIYSGSIVTKDTKEGCSYKGSPAKLINKQ